MSAAYETHRFEWDDITIEVRYDPDWSQAYRDVYGYPLAHLEIEAFIPAKASQDGAGMRPGTPRRRFGTRSSITHTYANTHVLSGMRSSGTLAESRCRFPADIAQVPQLQEMIG
jgi:hypothetical protein